MHLARALLTTLHLSALTTTSLIPSSPALAPRVPTTYDQWDHYLDAASPLFPNPPACTVLAQFYTRVLANLSPGGPWTRLPEWPSFVIGYGSLRLDFYARGGVVPWVVVTDFARRMEGHSRRGFAGRFRYVYVHAVTGLVVTVVLTVGGG